MIHYIFDVDGTLTPSRGKIDENFSKFFFDFCTLNKVYLVTGSDRAKTIEQVGNVIYGMCKRVYNCSGNDVYEGSTNIRTTDWTLPALARTFLISCEYESQFNLRTGNHIEERPGMVNFSIVGRNATIEDYIAYNGNIYTVNNDFNIASAFAVKDGKFIDVGNDEIFSRGADKSQILRDFKEDDTIHFYGDAMFEGGNDLPLAYALKDFQLGFSQLETHMELFKGNNMNRLGIAGYGFVGQAHAQIFEDYHQVLVNDPDKEHFADLQHADAIIVCVATPPDNNGHCDFTNIVDVINKAPDVPILIKSTISLEGWRYINQQYPNKDIAFSPEFLRADHAFSDFKYCREILIGGKCVNFWQK